MLETKIDKKLTISFQEAENKLKKLGQLHLLQSWDILSEKEKLQLLSDIESLEDDFLSTARQSFERPKETELEPLKIFQSEFKKEFAESGFKLLKEGKVGAVIVAGGEGARFGFNGPKGCFPLSNVRGKTLFQIFAEKTLYASRLVETNLFLAIMTSKKNHKETIEYFERNHYYGLNPSQVSFFQQTESPLLDSDKNLFLDSSFTIAKGPNGNGAFFKSFYSSGIFETWKKEGIKIINYIPIDNPLADPFDTQLLGFHDILQNEVTLKCISRTDPQENVGIIVQQNEKIKVIEYSELSEEEKISVDSAGKLKHLCANISLLCIHIEFIKSIATGSNKDLPYHLAFKDSRYKCEKFIFDILPFAKKVGVFLYPRNICFAPLKNRKGKDSPITVKEALLHRDIIQWKEITNTEAKKEVFELSQEFYYPTGQFSQKWKNKEMPSASYIEGDLV